MTNKEATDKWHKVYCEENIKKYKEESLTKENSKLEVKPMWNYRIIKFPMEDSHEYDYGLYETFYNEQGEVCGHDEVPTIVGASVEEIQEALEMMVNDVNRCKDDVLEGDQIKFAPFYDESEGLIEIKDMESFLKGGDK